MDERRSVFAIRTETRVLECLISFMSQHGRRQDGNREQKSRTIDSHTALLGPRTDIEDRIARYPSQCRERQLQGGPFARRQDVVYYAILRKWLLATAVLAGLVHLAGCKGVGTVCENSGSTSECGDELVCTFIRTPATFDPNQDPPPPLSVCLRQCTTSTDCADAEVCRFVYCSEALNSCQTGPVQDAPASVCGMGGMGGGGGMGGMGGGTGGTGGTPKCDSTAVAFIKTIDTFGSLTNNVTQDTTNLPTDWDTYSITLDLTNPALEGQSLQFGFSTLASDFGPAGVFYDNTVGERDGIGGASGSPMVEYQQDFEAPLDPADPDALANDGWLYFGNVFQEDGTFKFGFGPFVAPTTSGQISGIPSGEGGPAQGDQQLVVFSNYECCQPDEGHFNGTDVVETIVFQEITPIPAEFIGQVFQFTFDGKRGNINEGCPAPEEP